jgi:Mg2+-importing ATPase
LIPPRKSQTPEFIPLDQHEPLTWAKADKLLEEFGKNLINEQQARPWYKILGAALLHPFNFVLLVLAIVSAATLDFNTMVVMLAMIALSVSITVYQEYKAEKSAQALKNLVQSKVTVVRYPKVEEGEDNEHDDLEKGKKFQPLRQEIPIEDVVPGDIVFLSAGDLVPGDCLMYNSKDMFVSQAAMTGESLPVEKIATKLKSEKFLELIRNPYVVVEKLSKQDKSAEEREKSLSQDFNNDPNPSYLSLHRSDACFMGTSIVSGKGFAVVIKTGSHTWFGQMANDLAKQRPTNAFIRECDV